MNMMKNHTSSSTWPRCLLIAGALLVSQLLLPPLLTADTDEEAAAAMERERRLRLQQLGQARGAYYRGLERERSGRHAEAGSYYRLALDTLPAAERTAKERGIYADAFARICIHLADISAETGGLDDANRYIDAATEYAPDHAGVAEMRKRLDDPEWHAPADTRDHRAKVDRVRANLGQGQAALDLGEIPAAERHFYEVLKDDEFNQSARQGLERVERAKREYLRAARDHTRGELLADAAGKWAIHAPGRRRLPGEPALGLPPGRDTSQDIGYKLNKIIVPEISLVRVNIRAVVDYLQESSVELDFEQGVGVKFVLDERNIEEADPNTLNRQFSIRMKNVPLGVVVGYACELAGLRYGVEQFAVKISVAAGPDSEVVLTKTYSVPPGFEKMQIDGGGAVDSGDGGGGFGFGEDDSGSVVGPTAQEILQSYGVSFTATGASAFYNRGSNKLTVTNTQRNLDLVDVIVDSYRQKIEKQVEVRVKFLEIREDATEELGFDWLVNGFFISGSDRVLAGGGTLGNSRGTFATEQEGAYNIGQVPFFETATDADGNPVTGPFGINPVTASLRTGSQAIKGNAMDALLMDLPRGEAEALSPAPGILSAAGIFTEPQFQVIMRGLSQHKGADLVTAPTVVTKSAQKAKIEVFRELLYPVEFDPPELPQEVSSSQTGIFPVTPAHPTRFEMRGTGVTLEVDPLVGPDSYTIFLNLLPEVVEFDGFVNYGSEITAAGTDILGNPTQLVVTDNRVDLPVFTTRRLNTSVNIYDGSTVALGGLIREDVQEISDKVPIIGDLPYVGHFFRSSVEQHLRRNLVIFVTARLIDPAGMAFRKGLESQLASTPGLE